MYKMSKWEKQLKADMDRAMVKAGVTEQVKWETYSEPTSYGHKHGLVFYGASPEICERAARYFHKWAGKNVYKLKMIASAEALVSYLGAVTFTLYERNVRGKHIFLTAKETAGHATSYVYISSGD